jgi:broad specificity phosphatase PhoE
VHLCLFSELFLQLFVFSKYSFNSVKTFSDSDLTEKGEVQAQETADKLKKFSITRIFSSNLKRSKNTAKIINKIIGLPEEAVTSSAELNERHYG